MPSMYERYEGGWRLIRPSAGPSRTLARAVTAPEFTLTAGDGSAPAAFYPNGWRNRPDTSTPISEEALNSNDSRVSAALAAAAAAGASITPNGDGTATITVGTAPSAPQFAFLARNPDGLVSGPVTRDANGAAISAPVTWPDGTPGTYTADALSVLFPGAVDGYHITYGSPVVHTYTQPTVTRDSSGAAVVVPAIVVT